MNMRYFLPVVLAAMCLTSGCAGSDAAPRADETPKAGEVPQAPPPRAKKTPAELLVGTWNRVTFFDKPLRPGSKVLNQFTQDGRFTFTTTIPKTDLQVKTGVYRVVGNTIRLTSDATPDYPSKSWEVTIESISETELALTAGPPTEIQRSTYKRVEKQK